MIQLLYAVMVGSLIMTGAKEFETMEDCKRFEAMARQVNSTPGSGFACVELSE